MSSSHQSSKLEMKYEQIPLPQNMHKQEGSTLLISFKCPMPLKTTFLSSNNCLLRGDHRGPLYPLCVALCPPHQDLHIRLAGIHRRLVGTQVTAFRRETYMKIYNVIQTQIKIHCIVSYYDPLFCQNISPFHHLFTLEGKKDKIKS